MAFKQVQSLDADTTISLGGFNKKTKKDNPTSVEGYFLGSRTVEAAGKPCKIHFFQTSKGNIGVWGKTDLTRKLENIAPGTMVRASFAKMVRTKNGDMYQYRVEFDDENTIEVTTSGDDGGVGEDESYGASAEYGTEDEEEADTSSTTDAEDTALQTQAAADRRAQTQALLNRSKTARTAVKN